MRSSRWQNSRITSKPKTLLATLLSIQVQPSHRETYAYSLEEIQSILSLLPEPAATAFAIAAFMGLRYGEIRGLLRENYRDGEMHISRSIWNGRVTDPKTRKGRAPVPVIRQLAERLEMHRLRSVNPKRSYFRQCSASRSHRSVAYRQIMPTLNRCERCGKSSHRPRLRSRI